MKNKIDEIEIETTNSYFDLVINAVIILGVLVVIFTPLIIDYFTK